MTTREQVLLLAAGLLMWAVGTLYFGQRGQALLATAGRFWTAAILTAMASAAGCLALLYWRQVPPRDWAAAALLLAIPGLFGEVAALSFAKSLLPRLETTSMGRYAALLFLAYGVVLSLAEIVSLRAR